MANAQHYDYIIVGGGLAGLQLALEFSKHDFFNQKQIGIIDASKKNENDKTWSFWEKGPGKWDQITQKAWKKARFITNDINLELNLQPYKYKTIRSIDFYNHVKEELKQHPNFHFIIDQVESIEEDLNIKVVGRNSSYSCHHVFDSRIPEQFNDSDKYNTVIQHFKGIVIEVDKPLFNEEQFTMMDYRIKDGNQTTFTYVLPFSETKALIEFTYFTPETVEESVYDRHVEKYISHILKVDNYKIIEEEKGQIPMTDFPFESVSTNHITKIGTGGGWVKGSTGYSFKHTEIKVKVIAENLKNGRLPSRGLFKNRFKFYDRIFLKVLKDENHKGEWIFKQFYSKNRVTSMFRFLDEESTFAEEIQIMKSLFSSSFIKAFFKTL